MNKSSVIILANAMIWAAVILASAIVLRDTGLFGRMIPMLIPGAGASTVIVGAGLRRR